MKDKFKDTKGLDKAYMSLANHYEERKEKAIRQVKDGAFVDLLNQEMQELQNSMKDKEKQIKSDCEKCIHDKVCYDCLMTDKCWGKDNDCKHYQPKLPEDSVVLSSEEYRYLKHCVSEMYRLQGVVDNLTNEGWDILDEKEEKIRKAERKETAIEILTHLKNRQLIGEYELQKMAEKYGVEL